MIRRAGTSSPGTMTCLTKFIKEKVINKYCWPPPYFFQEYGRSKDNDLERTHVEKEMFLRVGEPNTRQETSYSAF